jgi:sugar fermentation stimulation protein A
MKIKGRFIKRINRFTVLVEVNKRKEMAYLPNSGRLKEILKEKNEVLLFKKEKGLPYKILGVKNQNIWIGVDSHYVNDFFEKLILKNKIPFLKGFKIEGKDKKIDGLKIDFVLKNNKRKIFCEIKSCTLLINKIAAFPDAPTERGVKHIDLLIKKKKEGYDSMIVFIIQREDAENFAPNSLTHFEFSKKVYEALLNGVKVYSIFTKFKNGCLIFKNYKKLDIFEILKNEYHLWRAPEVIIEKIKKIKDKIYIEIKGTTCLYCSFEENLFDFLNFASERGINFKVEKIWSYVGRLKAILKIFKK